MTSLLNDKLASLEQAGVSPALVEQIGIYVEQAGAPGLAYVPPFRLADQWGFSHQTVLEAFLQGTRLGVFDLSWNLHCPSCRGVAEHAEHLHELDSHGSCEFCQINFKGGFDDLVEVNFEVNANIREKEEFSLTDFHAYWDAMEKLSTFSVGAGESYVWDYDFDETSYYVQIVGTDHDLAFPVRELAEREECEFALTYDGKTFDRDKRGALRAGPLQLRLVNESEDDIEVRLFRIKKYPWVSAATVASTQSFRDFFDAELISPEDSFSIRSLVFVFTDIKGSTALYERLGDSAAYLLVKEHFRILTEQVREHNGAVVKTIGDAVMATFMLSADAVEALFDMQRAFDQFNAEGDTRDDIIIKVGAHRGPCIAVSSNDRLDYFGHTVNVASRIQGLSSGRDIVISRALYDEPAVRKVVAATKWQLDHFNTELRGLLDEHAVVHLKPSEV